MTVYQLTYRDLNQVKVATHRDKYLATPYQFEIRWLQDHFSRECRAVLLDMIEWCTARYGARGFYNHVGYLQEGTWAITSHSVMFSDPQHVMEFRLRW